MFEDKFLGKIKKPAHGLDGVLALLYSLDLYTA